MQSNHPIKRLVDQILAEDTRPNLTFGQKCAQWFEKHDGQVVNGLLIQYAGRHEDGKPIYDINYVH